MRKQTYIHKFFLVLIACLIVSSFSIVPASAMPNILFPVLGGGKFSNDFTAPRFNGQHRATDIFAPKHTMIVSPVDGYVYYLMNPEPNWGWSLGIRGDDGYDYNFLHLNNDTEGTDDARGGPMKAYAADMKVGNRVVRGQHIGWLGDSGNAETTPPHLHFEIYDQNDNHINPYTYLLAAPRITTPTTIYPTQQGEVLPYGPSIKVTTQVAAGNLDADPGSEYVTAAGTGGGPHVRVFNEDDSFEDYGFMAYASDYTGGVNVAVGDVDSDGIDEIVTGTNPGSTTHVRVFEKNGQPIGGFFAYGGYYTGVNVATADMDGDGMDEIVTGTGPGSTSHIKVFKLDGRLIDDFLSYPGYYVGSDVAGGDVDGDGNDEIITSPVIGTAHVKVFNREKQLTNDFIAYGGFYGGTRVDVGNVQTATAKEEIMTAPYKSGGPDIRMFNEAGSLLSAKGIYESWWSGNFDIAATDDFSVVGTGGNRRSSVRTPSF